MAQPEHDLQTQVHKWARECIAEPHEFLAFDRSRKQSAMQHIREKARGVKAGTPDFLLIGAGKRLWVELKAGKNSTTTMQDEMHARLAAVGEAVLVLRSVAGVMLAARAAGFALTATAAARAEGLDALLARPKAEKQWTAKAARRETSRRGIAAIGRAARAGVLAV